MYEHLETMFVLISVGKVNCVIGNLFRPHHLENDDLLSDISYNLNTALTFFPKLFFYITVDFMYDLLHWPAFLVLFQIPKRRAYHSDSFFPAEYDYLKTFLSTRPDLPKFYVNDQKIALNGCF